MKNETWKTIHNLDGHYEVSDENGKDMVRHGTSARGERHGMAKVTKSQVTFIRNSNLDQSILAAKFGINQSQISRIKTKYSWAATACKRR